MEQLRLFLEHRTVNEIKIICSQTKEEIDPEYDAYDETSLNSIISRYKQNKEQFEKLCIFFCYLKGNKWVAQTSTNYKMDLSRMNDKFLSSGKVDYSFDDIVSLLEDGDTMLIFTKNNE